MYSTFCTSGLIKRAGRSPAKKTRPASTRTDPKAARSPKLALPRGQGQEDRRTHMRTESANGTLTSPGRLFEMLTDRFGAFEAIAMASIKLARHVPEAELSMDRLVAEAVLEFGDDLRAASEAAEKWTREEAASHAN
jgi:hypothetical protein